MVLVFVVLLKNVSVINAEMEKEIQTTIKKEEKKEEAKHQMLRGLIFKIGKHNLFPPLNNLKSSWKSGSQMQRPFFSAFLYSYMV